VQVARDIQRAACGVGHTARSTAWLARAHRRALPTLQHLANMPVHLKERPRMLICAPSNCGAAPPGGRAIRCDGTALVRTVAMRPRGMRPRHAHVPHPVRRRRASATRTMPSPLPIRMPRCAVPLSPHATCNRRASCHFMRRVPRGACAQLWTRSRTA
jgi:hypothetical protein